MKTWHAVGFLIVTARGRAFSRPDALEEIGEELRRYRGHGSLWRGSPSPPKITVRRG
jgi:hypothetical protein